jgi:hypothetical protein
MRKTILIAGIVLLFAGCENLVTDLPNTDTNKYISGNTVTFPRGTKAIDIYNTIAFLFPESEYRDVNGEWEYIKTETDKDGLIIQTWQSVSFTKIRHSHSTRDPEINTHTVYLFTNEASIREIIFEWQRQTTNIWKNKSTDGDIIFTF